MDIAWQQWLGGSNRCLVPATAFFEYEQVADPATGMKPLRTKTIDIKVFAQRDTIQWIWLETPYYVSVKDRSDRRRFP